MADDIDAQIDQELAKRERDPQLRIVEALEEIAIQLKRLNENRTVVLSQDEAKAAFTESGAGAA